MRNISTASLAKLAQKTGTEPVCLVEVAWETGSTVMYADKNIDEIDGRIIQISSFDDVLNISKSGTSQNVTVTLDDTDGLMKQIFNQVDIHKKLVNIYQWFTGIPLSDKILLFSGVIASPIIWKEGDRTLTFSVISKTSDVEVGFSPEEGLFANLPEGLVGTVWPLVFGTVAKLPAIRVDEIPYTDGSGDLADSQTTDDHGIEDPAIEPHIRDQDNQANYGQQLALAYFIGYLEASYTARRLGELGDLDDIDKGKGTYSSLAKQYLAQGNKYLLQAQSIKRKNQTLQTTLRAQQRHNTNEIGVSNGNMFRQGVERTVKIGDGLYTGMFVGDSFQISDVQHPASEQYQDVPDVIPGSNDPPVYLSRNNFFWNPAGQRLSLSLIAGDETDDPDDIRYIVASTIQVSVDLVYAYREIDGFRRLSIVPPNLYSVHQASFGTLPVTMILVPDALSTLTDSAGKSLGWDDELYVTCTSPIGPNTVDIIQWLITTYTGHACDATSFDYVRALVDNYPSHFAYRQRTNVIALVQEIAYQARCIVWLKNNIFHIKYLAKKETPVATITEADIIEQSLEVSYTETEDLTTKVIASWVPDYFKQKPNLVILRYNIRYYGLHELRKDYFIYNMQQLVEKSSVFWLIRDANTFKRVTCKVPIKFLTIETLDTITLNFTNSFIANGPIDCIVESAILDTGDYTIALTIWVPVRAGEMVEYPFCFPADVSVEYYFPPDRDITSGRAGSGGGVEPNSAVDTPVTGDNRLDKPLSGDSGNGGSLHIGKRPLTYGPDPTYFADGPNTAPQITSRIDSTAIKPISSAKPSGTTNYQLTKAIVKDEPIVSGNVTAVFPAMVTGGGPGEGPYSLDVYLQGTDNNATVVPEAWQLQIDEEETIPEGTWCLVNRLVYKGADDKDVVEWYIQLPVWM